MKHTNLEWHDYDNYDIQKCIQNPVSLITKVYATLFNSKYANLKGVFTKNDEKSVSTNLTSIFCVYNEKIVKHSSHNEERSVHTNSESCNITIGSFCT